MERRGGRRGDVLQGEGGRWEGKGRWWEVKGRTKTEKGGGEQRLVGGGEVRIQLLRGGLNEGFERLAWDRKKWETALSFQGRENWAQGGGRGRLVQKRGWEFQGRGRVENGPRGKRLGPLSKKVCEMSRIGYRWAYGNRTRMGYVC
jgi:hypothetical protein